MSFVAKSMALTMLLALSMQQPHAVSAQARQDQVNGDWLLGHMLSDPEQLNPLTSNDAGASAILGYIIQSLLTLDPRTLELKPLLAEARPVISADKLTYTFKIRRDTHFQDGRKLTGEDVLFSVKAVKCPLVNAPFARVYYESVVDAQLVDPYTIRFHIKEPYFLNETMLGGIDVLPRHYYDPQNLLKDATVKDLAGDPSKPEQKARYVNAPSANGWLCAPDNVAFDPKGRVWISTDGQEDIGGFNDSLYAAQTSGPRRGATRCFFTAPDGAEVCGPEFTPDGKTLFLSIQHPGDGSTFDKPSTRWPDFRPDMGPRGSVLAITKDDGGEIGG
jgi:hypothetical protein